MFVSLNELNESGRLLVQYDSVVQNEEKITDVMVAPKRQYFLAATSEGFIHVYKYKITRKLEAQKHFMHTFERHNKAVTSISPYGDSKDLVLSISLDGHAKIWDLSTFTLHYDVYLMTGINFCKIFRSGRALLCARLDAIIQMEMHMILETYMPESAACRWLGSAFGSHEDRLQHNPNFTVILNKDNSAYIKELSGKKEHFVIYPPP